MPAWIPSPREFRGLALALGLGLVALVATPIVFQASPWASSVVVAIGLGALVLNSPIARGLGLNLDGLRDGDPYEPGLRYTGKWLLRIAIVLMGLSSFLRGPLILVIPLALRRHLADGVGRKFWEIWCA